MECSRCSGLMMTQSFVHGLSEVASWKCLNCGHIISKKEKTLDFDEFSVFYHQNKLEEK